MTVLSAGIVTRQGKILLSRQFVDISRIRIEGLLSAFPKLITSTHSNSSTFLETGGVRYVYQPVESFYLVLVTTRSSNIIEDLSTLRMMGSLISVHVDEVSEERIAANAFEILFSFDEVIVNGEREDNTMQDVMLFLEMRSEAEEQAKEEKKKQEELAAKEARRREREITAKRREMGFGGVGSHNQGHGSGSGGRGGNDNYMDDEEAPAKRYGGDDGANRFASVVQDNAKKAPKAKTAGGMSLSRARKADVSSKVLQEAAPKAVAPAAPAASEAAGSTSTDGIHLRVEETISATLHRDGGTSSVDLRGDLFITISDAQLASVRVLLGRLNESDFTFRTHPNINKSAFTSDRVLCIKDNKPFPTHQSQGILKWRLNSGNTQLKAPLSVTCWAADNSATIEFELTQKNGIVLQQVVILIPTQGFAVESSEPSCGSVESAEEGAAVQWTINNVDAHNATGSLELTLASDATDDVFFPMQVGFVSQRPSMAGVNVAEVVGMDNGMPVRFSTESVLSAEDYIIN